MASVEAAYNGSSGGAVHLHIDASEISVDSVNNQSLVNVTVYMVKVGSTTVFNLGNTPGSITVNGNNVGETVHGYDFRSSSGPFYLVQNYQQWIPHNPDGTGSCGVSASHDAQDSPFLTTSQSCSLTLGLTTINRFAAINSFTVDTNTDTGFNINVSTDVTCDLLEYSLDGGSTFTSVSGTFTSKTVTVTGLVSGTTYPVVVRVRRQDSQLKTTSGTVNGTTLTATNFFFGDVI